MSKKLWKERFCDDGICDFRKNYDFYFKWLLSKTCSCFYFKNLPDTLDEFYIKSTLLCEGDICISEWDGSLYAVSGFAGGEPDEYYKPTVYTMAQPRLGSKSVNVGENGVVIYNTPLDAYIGGGLYGLISQTATLLADNIVSINCCQINSRVAAFITADSEAQAIAAENILKNLYAGKPYKVMRSDLIDKINVNPIATAATSNTISELVELHNYIISNYFQSIGIRANNMRKKAHLLQDEIDVQNEFLQVSIYEIMSSWQKGFDMVNKMYGTEIEVCLSPALVDELIETPTDETTVDTDTPTETPTEELPEETPTEEQPEETTPEPQPEELPEKIEDANEQITDIIDIINDNEPEENEPENTDEFPGLLDIISDFISDMDGDSDD